jgi:mycothiol system anti-sigma-R factor
MDCKRVKEIIYLFVDNEMEDDLRGPFEQHLAECGDCDRSTSRARRMLVIIRERCVRVRASESLRRRIADGLRSLAPVVGRETRL